MTSLNIQLWELIETHKMPDDAAGKPFIEQLMAENRISLDTATTAITEYKKFMYLCATRPARNVPSKAVDLVWHLHMQHSRDYWEVFCRTLGKPVHHTPGGEGSQHLSDYKATIKAYKRLFGEPPKGIWKQTSKFGAVISLLFLMLVLVFLAASVAQGDDPVFNTLWIGVVFALGVATLNGLTPKGEFTLVFESNDTFGDDNAGDCSAGDCGGCGD